MNYFKKNVDTSEEIKVDVLKSTLVLLDTIGMHPKKTSIRRKLVSVIGIIIWLGLYVLVNINFYVTENSITSFAKKFEAHMTFDQVFFRHLILWKYKDNISELLDQQKNYWDLNDFHLNDRIKMYRLMNFSYIALKVFFTFGICCVVMMLVVPLTSVHEEPFDCWIPNKFYLNFASIYIAQFLFLLYILFLIIGFDVLFMGFCVHLLIQFKLLKIKLRNVTFTNEKEIQKIVKHHNFLINSVTSLRSIYSIHFTAQIVITTLTICMELYICMETDVSFSQFIRNVVFSICLTSQFSFYCFPATEVSEELNGISGDIYNSMWYENILPSKYYMQFVTMRAQKKVAFTAGGLSEISRETFTFVFQTCMSFLAVMRSSNRRKAMLENIN